jgi:hypothetical protein
VTNSQLYFAIGVPILFNITITLSLLLFIHASLRQRIDDGFAAINQRFDDMRELWRAELHRVEEVLDARLKAMEERHQ